MTKKKFRVDRFTWDSKDIEVVNTKSYHVKIKDDKTLVVVASSASFEVSPNDEKYDDYYKMYLEDESNNLP